MTGNGMTGQPGQWSEDLLSAYADGEATAEQRALVDAILQRELAIMATSAFVVATLVARAAELL